MTDKEGTGASILVSLAKVIGHAAGKDRLACKSRGDTLPPGTGAPKRGNFPRINLVCSGDRKGAVGGAEGGPIIKVMKAPSLEARPWTRPVLRLVWIIGVLTVIAGSLLPGNSTPIQALDRLHINDKVEHAMAHAALALLPVLHEQRRRQIVLILIVAAMGILLEFGQLYSQGRSFDTRDMLADIVGVIIGATTGLLLRFLLPRQLIRA
jgi:VanZ family protein